MSPTLYEECVRSLTSHIIYMSKGCETGPTVYRLWEKTRKSNYLHMSLQREHFLLSYLNTLSVGPAGVFPQQTGAYLIELTFLRQQ